MVFKPEVGEFLTGKVVAQNERGVFATVGTIGVFLPAERLMKPYFL